MKIITTCPLEWADTGVYWYLKNLEFVSNTKHIPWNQFQIQDADLVISCGIGEVDLLKLKRQKVKVGVLFCSPLAQAHIVPSSPNGDLDSLLRYVNMLKSGDIDYVFLASKQLAELFKNDKIIYLPPPLHWEGFPITKIEDRKGIGYFGTMDRHKNLATMFGAVKHSGIEDPFIITGSEKISMCSFFSHLFDMKNIFVYPRFSRPALFEIMSKVKLGIQIGFSESFSYTVWESAMLGVPSIVSPSIWWYCDDPFLKSYCMVQNLDDPILIGEKIKNLYLLASMNKDCDGSAIYVELCKVAKKVAIETMNKNNQMIQEIFEKL